MVELLFTMLERLGMIVTIAFVLTRLRFFREMVYSDHLNRRQQYMAILFFGFFGIIGTYSGLTFSTDTEQFQRWTVDVAADEAIANSRVIGIVLAGLLGGYKVGVGAGLIAGIHRFSLGGFTGLACGIASIVAGFISGSFRKRNKHVKLSHAFLIGGIAETVQMVIILVLARPLDKAITLVELIGVPMILANGVGSALFLMIIKNVINEEQKVGALQAQKTLRIADQTLVYLRNGLNAHSAQAVCQILYNEIQPSAVAMTDRFRIIAHVGLGDDHHRVNSPLQTQITKEVIEQGKLKVANDTTIHCVHKDCPLSAAVIAPLQHREQTIGTLKFYFQSEKEITNVIIELISGLSVLLSNQLEIAEADRAYQLAKEAEIKALQAQISPHFLFNSLNTIVSLVRIEPNKARDLLVSLSNFLRQNLMGTTVKMTTLAEELKHVKAYLAIEEARFVDKLTVSYDIESEALTSLVPPLTLQPIVENAVKHGIQNKDKNCMIHIHIHSGEATTTVMVIDNGEGMSQERLQEIGVTPLVSESGTGLGLYNVNRRLTMMFGEKSNLTLQSVLKVGTEVSFKIPKSGGRADGAGDKGSSR
ncbi:sensor histidine kinase [Bacillus fonticola]|uniref:sensor histidine kinase n=1 Tax=Bacillus fonticola TaxID=2728853 RepID=UPI0014758113|nr:sensor histidine kinase [Bacillus fonticola]